MCKTVNLLHMKPMIPLLSCYSFRDYTVSSDNKSHTLCLQGPKLSFQVIIHVNVKYGGSVSCLLYHVRWFTDVVDYGQSF